MNTRTALLLAIAPGMLAACSQNSAPDAAASLGAEATEAVPDPIAASDAMPAEEPTADIATAEPDVAMIPAAAQGRWGMVPADCTSTRGDAKGLMMVGDKSIKFYESRATLSAVKDSSPTRIEATFAFEGEGMQWTRDLTMDVQDGGKTLIRREYGVDAQPGPLKYTRCPA